MKSLFFPTISEQRARIRSDIRLGLPVNFKGGAFVAIEHLNKSRFTEIMEQGNVRIAITANRALALHLSHDPSRAGILHLPKSYSFEKLLALADPSMDLDYPGKGPLAQADYIHEIEEIFTLCRSAKTLPAVIILPSQVEGAFKLISAPDEPFIIQKKSSAPVPLKLAQHAEVHVFRSPEIDEEHYAIRVKNSGADAPLVRVHSACFTGDCLGSLKCDCGPQLEGALELIGKQGGLLLYMSQEGRGIGMANKMRAYKLQTQGYDTVEANERLGFADDERNFDLAAQMLSHFGLSRISLITNNPRKIRLLEGSGINVAKRVPLQITPVKENAAYLRTKAKKSGHLL